MKKQQILKHTQMILIVMTYLAGLGALFFVADIKLWSGIAAVSAAILAIVLLLGKEKKLAAVILFGSCFMEGIWIIVKIYPLYLAGIYVMMLSLGVLFTGSIQERKKSREKNQEKSQEKGGGLRAAVSGAGIILATAVVLLTLFLSVTAATSVPMIKFMQKNMMNGAGNSFEPKKNIIEDIEDGVCLSNLEYGSEYPNSFLDIYLTDTVPSEEAPTYIFFHGGGYVWGDKQEGDPNGGSDKGLQWYIQQFVKKGYNVVSPNYALGPDYKFPTPVIQMTRVLQFLKENQDEYHINMEHVILGGNSGGGQLAGIMALIHTNPDYAKTIGIEAVLVPSEIEAVVFSSALIDNYRSYKTGDPGADYLFLQCGKAYYGWEILEEKTDIVNIIDHATENFPSSFISDGNNATFYDQAFDLHEKLNSLGVPNEINWYPPSEARLGHDFETQATEYSVENLEKIFVFLETVIE